MGVTYINPYRFAAFSPLDLSPVAWWDSSNAAAFTFSSGTSVSQWNSEVGGYALVQATASKQPSRSGSVNGIATVVFDGNNDSMSTSTTLNMGSGQQFSLWYVATFAAGTTQVMIEQTSNYNFNLGAFLSYHDTTNQIFITVYKSQFSQFLTSGTITTTPKSLIATHDGTLATNETTAWLNGTSAGTRPLNADTNVSNRNSTLFVGARDNSSFFLNGQICELGFTTSILSAANISDLSAYLATKWAL